MAKGLKVGDAVVVREELRLPRKTDAYQQGLRRLKPSDIGRIVNTADGRSVIVDFGGVQVTLASQRLNRAEEPKPAPVEAPATEAPRRGRRKGQTAASTQAAKSDRTGLIDYTSPRFLTVAANALLRSGGENSDPETVVVQVKLADLPADVQKKVQSLIQAKLDLTPDANSSSNGSSDQPARKSNRGRKPKQK
jgi:hypothetical protein